MGGGRATTDLKLSSSVGDASGFGCSDTTTIWISRASGRGSLTSMSSQIGSAAISSATTGTIQGTSR
jgi:hypothetical protein